MTSTLSLSPSRMMSSVTVSPGLCAAISSREVVVLEHRLAVDGDHDVAAGLHPLELEGVLAGRALQARVVGGAAVDHVGDQGAGLGVEPEMLGELRVERLAGHAEIRVLDLAVGLELVERVADRGHRDREADAGVAPRARGDLLVDPDHLALGVEQRPARVPRVDRGVGLDRVVDPEVREPLDGPVGGRDRRRSRATAPRRTGCRSPRPARRRRSSERSESCTGSRSRPSGSTLISATSASASKPMISAGTRLRSPNSTKTCLAS